MTLVRIALVGCLALAACVKPGSAPAPHSSYDFYNLCGDVHADGVCAPSAEQAPLVDTNLASPAYGTLVALG